MATNRFGYSDDFVLKNGKVGINTTEPQEKLDVVGVVKGQDLKVTGVSSFTTYEGFLEANHTIDESITLTSGTSSSLSGEIIVGTGVTVTIANVGLGTTTVGVGNTTAANGRTTNTIDTDEIVSSGQGGIDSLKVYNTFTVPTGGTEDRPSKVKPGQLYYNVDFKTIEFWDGNNWRQVDNTTRSGRAVFTGGSDNEYTMQFFNINTLGNAEYFGTLNDNHSLAASFGSETRGITAGGYQSPGISNQDMDYYTIASAGNSIDFGDLVESHFRNCDGCSSSTRGLIFAGGHPAYYNTIEYVQINTLGASKDFGDQTVSLAVKSSFSSSTRGFAFGGFPAPTPVIDVVTISSLGNAVKFGDLTRNVHSCASFSSSVRGVWGGGYRPGSELSKGIQYITMSSGGNSIDFGELSLSRYHSGATSTNVRGVWGGGENPARYNIMEYVTIASTGNAQDFGDLIRDDSRMGGTSDSHGGLGGF